MPHPAPLDPSELSAAKAILHSNIQASAATLQSLTALAEPLARAARMATDCLLSGHKLLTCGNGGSASDAAHLATEFVARFHTDRRPFPPLSPPHSGSTLPPLPNH